MLQNAGVCVCPRTAAGGLPADETSCDNSKQQTYENNNAEAKLMLLTKCQWCQQKDKTDNSNSKKGYEMYAFRLVISSVEKQCR